MKRKVSKRTKIIIYFFTLVLIFFGIFILNKNSRTYAADTGRTPDVQLLARAINGEARGEPYEGQVAVRSGYIK